MSLASKTLNYRKKYQVTYKKAILEAWKRENDRIISRSINHTKALWQITKKKLGNYQKINQNISLKISPMIVTNPEYISHQFNAFFRRDCG
jgi:hypothetical protein